jgi:hypothetical protein
MFDSACFVSSDNDYYSKNLKKKKMIVEQFSQEINNKNKLPQPASGRYKKKKK